MTNLRMLPVEPRLGRDFYQRATLDVARDLLGKVIVRRLPDCVIAGLVVEVEAYLSADDPASHSARGRSNKNASMFMQPGTLYVYPIHAKYCMNVVTEPEGCGAAVLIRALQPLEGLERIAELRGVTEPRGLVTGPARLCQALAVDRSLDGVDLTCSEDIWLELPPRSVVNQREWQIRCSPRIGLSLGQELRLRWFIDGHRYVSGCARDHSSGRNWAFAVK